MNQTLNINLTGAVYAVAGSITVSWNGKGPQEAPDFMIGIFSGSDADYFSIPDPEAVSAVFPYKFIKGYSYQAQVFPNSSDEDTLKKYSSSRVPIVNPL